MAAAPRSRNKNLPPRLMAVRKKKTYYYYDAGTGAAKRYLPLGSDFITAMRKWAEHEQGDAMSIVRPILTFGRAADRYVREELPKKGRRTQTEYLTQLVELRNWFDDGIFSEISPHHIRAYLDAHRHRPIRANREIALFSAIWNHAREWGITDRANPCRGVKKHKEHTRTAYISDAQYAALYAVAGVVLKDAMDLAYHTGQRPSDVLSMRESDIRDGCIEVRQAKTKTPLRIEIIGKLAEIVARIKARKTGAVVYDTSLIVGERGKAVSQHYIRTLWVAARKAAKLPADLQFRDLRAKAVSDKEEQSNIRDAQSLAGHSTVTMTEAYSRNRRGKKVSPVR